MKLYILVRKSIADQYFGLAVTSVAHAAAAAILKWESDPDGIITQWADTSFKKVVCLVTDDQFEQAKKQEKAYNEELDYIVLTESVLDHQEISLVFKPREEWPKFFKFLSLWK